MGVGQLSESDAVDALRLPFYSSSHPTGSHGWRNQFDLGNPDSGFFVSMADYVTTSVARMGLNYGTSTVLKKNFALPACPNSTGIYWRRLP